MVNNQFLFKTLNSIETFFYSKEEQLLLNNNFFNLLSLSFDHRNIFKGQKSLYGIILHMNNIFLLIGAIDTINIKRTKEPIVLFGMKENMIALFIQYIHVEIRSIMDFIAQFISQNTHPQTSESYHKLIKQAEKDTHNSIPNDLKNLILESRIWFNFIRTWRDQFIHQSLAGVVHPKAQNDDNKDILFGDFNNTKVSFLNHDYINQYGDLLKYNHTTIFSQRYITISLSEMLFLLENIAKHYIKELKLIGTHKLFYNHEVLTIYQVWIKSLKQTLTNK